MLNHQDIELTMQALDALEHSDSMNHMLGSMMGAMLSKDEESYRKFQAEEDAARKLKEAKNRALKDQIAVFKAKLITMRQQLDGDAADRLLAESR